MKILIAIHGSHSQPDKMRAQRETWLRTLAGKADYKFFLGLPASEGQDVVSLDTADGPIWDAQRGCGHRTPVGQRKTEGLAKYALENGYDYVFKCDDDTYIDIDRLLASGFEQHDYSGFTEMHWERDIQFYRWAQGGAGYWLSRRAMAIVVENGLHLVPIEDYAVGQILHRNGITPFHDERYIPGATDAQLASANEEAADWITLHKVSADRMRTIYAARRIQPKDIPTTLADHTEEVIAPSDDSDS